MNTTQTRDTRALEALKAVVPNLPISSRDFATSMINQHRRKGSLSPRQWDWVGKLTDKANTPRAELPQDDLGDFAEVFELLQTATASLKYPKVRLQTACGNPVVLSILGPRSKHAGEINVTDGGGYGTGRWYGRVNGKGRWVKPRTAEKLDAVGDVLRRLGDAPAETAAAYGKLTGHCCFCRKGLTDDRSLAQGYGPVCAGHYDLPWGS